MLRESLSLSVIPRIYSLSFSIRSLIGILAEILSPDCSKSDISLFSTSLEPSADRTSYAIFVILLPKVCTTIFVLLSFSRGVSESRSRFFSISPIYPCIRLSSLLSDAIATVGNVASPILMMSSTTLRFIMLLIINADAKKITMKAAVFNKIFFI